MARPRPPSRQVPAPGLEPHGPDSRHPQSSHRPGVLGQPHSCAVLSDHGPDFCGIWSPNTDPWAPSCFLLGRTPRQPEVPHGRDSPASPTPGGPRARPRSGDRLGLPASLSELLGELSCSQASCGDGGHPQAALSPRNVQAYEPHSGLAAEPGGKVPLGSAHPQLPGARQETGGCQLALWSFGEPVSVS